MNYMAPLYYLHLATSPKPDLMVLYNLRSARYSTRKKATGKKYKSSMYDVDALPNVKEAKDMLSMRVDVYKEKESTEDCSIMYAERSL